MSLLSKKERTSTLDIWSAKSAMVASLAFSNVAADKDFADVAVPASFLPSGARIVAVYLLVKWRKQVDSSGGANAISAASKKIRVKKSTGAWGTDDVVAMTMAQNSWNTAANATEGGDVLIGSADISGEVDADNATYNVRSEETNRGDAITVTAASLTLYDIECGLRFVYKV